MKKQQIVTVLLAIIVTILGTKLIFAQENEGEKSEAAKTRSTFRLDFTISEMDDSKTLNSRGYTMMLTGTMVGQVRAGSRLPVQQAMSETAPATTSYLDIGQSIDSRIISEQDRYLVLDTTLEISSLAPASSGGDVPLSGKNPVIRQLKARTFGSVELGKPTMISSLDDVSSRRRFRLEVVATKIR